MSDLTPAELDALLTKVVGQAGQALSASAIQEALPKAYRPPLPDLKRHLKALVEHGRLYAWSPTRWSARPLEDSLRELVLAALSLEPLTRSEIERRIPTSGRKLLPGVLRQLIDEGRLFKHPRRGRREEFALGPADPADYLEPDLGRLVAGLVRKGFTPEAVRTAIAQRLAGAAPAAEPDLAAALLAAMEQLDPQVRQGALVYVPHLRVAMAGRVRAKADFDRLVLALAGQRRVQVQAHPVPSQLSDAEREAMVPDGTGGFYMAIGRRSG